VTVFDMFEDFTELQLSAENRQSLADEASEDAKLKAFEQGYGAGWEDAIKAKAQGEQELSEAVREALMQAELSRTDAMETFIAAIQPVLDALVAQVLPDLARASLHRHIADVIASARDESMDLAPVVVVSEADFRAVRAAFDSDIARGMRIEPSAQLLAGHACIKLSKGEQFLDLPGLVAEIKAAVDSHLHALKQEIQHGQ